MFVVPIKWLSSSSSFQRRTVRAVHCGETSSSIAVSSFSLPCALMSFAPLLPSALSLQASLFSQQALRGHLPNVALRFPCIMAAGMNVTSPVSVTLASVPISVVSPGTHVKMFLRCPCTERCCDDVDSSAAIMIVPLFLPCATNAFLRVTSLVPRGRRAVIMASIPIVVFLQTRHM